MKRFMTLGLGAFLLAGYIGITTMQDVEAKHRHRNDCGHSFRHDNGRHLGWYRGNGNNNWRRDFHGWRRQHWNDNRFADRYDRRWYDRWY